MAFTPLDLLKRDPSTFPSIVLDLVVAPLNRPTYETTTSGAVLIDDTLPITNDTR